MQKDSIFKKVYNFYSSDLTSDEFERIFVKESQARYKYYLRNMEKPAENKNRFIEIFTFTKNFFVAFLKKLSPVIRIIYTFAVIGFIFSMITENWNFALLTFAVMNVLLFYEVADMLTARDELDVARHVQTSLIPTHPPEDDTYEISYHYETAREVGGDFIDFIIRDDGSYYISIGDISGKGMSAALYMVQVRLLMRHLADFSDNPKAILSSVNKNIFKHITKGLYFSAVLAEVKNNNLRICRAGHTPLLYYNASSRTCCEIRQKGMALGLNNSNLFETSLEEFEVTTNPDDVLLFYSDGLTETMNHEKNEFGLSKVKSLLIEHADKSADEIRNELVKKVLEFRGFAEIHDDMTLIVMKQK